MSATSDPKPFPSKIILAPEQNKWLIAHFKHTKNDEIMARLGLTHSTLHRIVRELGLTKSRQFMKKCQLNAAQRGREVCIATGRYAALKGKRPPNSDANCFKKGQSNRDRLSPKRYKEMNEKRRQTWLQTRAKDKARFTFGFEQKTKFRFVKQPKSKVSYRYNMKKKGYIVDLEHNVFFYPSEEMRHPLAERNGAKFGIKFLPLPKGSAVPDSCESV